MPKTKKSKGSKDSDATTEKRKPGNQGIFSGEELAFLESQFQVYYATDGFKTTFWENFYPVYFEKFPFTETPTATASLSTDTDASSREDPKEGDNAGNHVGDASVDPDNASSVRSNAPNTAENAADPNTQATQGPGAPDAGDGTKPNNDGGDQRGQKATTLAGLKKQLKTWFSNRKTREVRVEQNPFTAWFQHLNRSRVAPRRLPAHKFYMHHPDHKGKVDAKYNERFGPDAEDEVDENRALAERVSVAKELFDREPQELREVMATGSKEAYDVAVKQYEGFGNAVENPESVSVQLAREHFSSAAQPLANGLRSLTGYHITITAGAPPSKQGEKWSITSVHSGKTADGKDLTEFDPEGYRSTWMKHFCKYLLATPEGLAFTGTGNNDPNAEVATEHISQPAHPTTANPAANPAANSTLNASRASAAPTAVLPINGADVDAPNQSGGKKRGRRKSKGGRSRKGRRDGQHELPDTPESTPELDDPSPPRDSPGPNEAPSRPTTPEPPEETEPTPPPPTTPVLKPGRVLGDYLKQQLTAMATPERRKAMGEFRRLSQYELTRKDNILRNNELLGALAIKNVSMGPRTEGGPSRDPATRAPKPPPAAKSDPPPPTRRSNRKTATTTLPSEGAGLMEVDQSGWPNWMKGAFNVVGRDIGGERWKQLVVEWVGLERSYGFANPGGAKGSLPSISRPAEVHWWIKNARTTRSPGIKDVNAFADDWWIWWTTINPEWRQVDVEGRFTRVEEQEGEDWDNMRRPGPNGLLSVIACLFWWLDAGDDSEGTSDWQDAVADVSWVIRRLSPASRKRARDEGDQDSDTNVDLENADDTTTSVPASKRVKTS